MRKTEHLSRGRLIAVPGAAALLSLALSLSPALGDQGSAGKESLKVTSETTATITPITAETATYAGQVTSKPVSKGKGKKEKRRRQSIADRCTENRIVEVWHKAVGEFKIGETTTDEKGRWNLVGNLAPTGDPVTVNLEYEGRGSYVCYGKSRVLTSP
jgi:hypothetical protein